MEGDSLLKFKASIYVVKVILHTKFVEGLKQHLAGIVRQIDSLIAPSTQDIFQAVAPRVQRQRTFVVFRFLRQFQFKVSSGLGADTN